MSFDIKAFINEQFTPRTVDYPVPKLKDWFKNGEKPVWKIRSLNGAEIGRADEAVQNEGMTAKILEAVTSMNSTEVATQIKELMGKSDGKPKSIAKRIYHLMYGSVEPECNLELAVKVCDFFPVVFF